MIRLLSNVRQALSKHTPQRRGHQSLLNISALEHPPHLVAAEQTDLYVFRLVEMLAAHKLHAHGKEAVSDICHGAGIGRNDHQLCPHAAAIAGLLSQFATRGGLRLLAGFYHSGHNLVAGLAYAVTVLPDKDVLSATSHGNYVYPIGLLQHVILIVDSSVGQLNSVTPCRQPRAADQVFAAQCTPIHVAFAHNIQTFVIFKVSQYFQNGKLLFVFLPLLNNKTLNQSVIQEILIKTFGR